MSDAAIIIEHLMRGPRNTTQQVTEFARWVAAGGADRRELWLTATRGKRCSTEPAIATDLPTSPVRTR